jgi:hypothetical protein
VLLIHLPYTSTNSIIQRLQIPRAGNTRQQQVGIPQHRASEWLVHQLEP